MRWLVHFNILSSLFLSLSLNGQQVTPSVINTSGGNKNIGEVYLDWSIGELPTIQTSSGTNIYVTNGFLQAGSGFIPTGILNLPPLTSNEIKIFPNPSTGVLNIRFELAQPGTISMYLYDISGKKLMERKILHLGGSQSTIVYLTPYPQGSYQLLLYYKTAYEALPKAGAFKLVKVK